MKRLKIGVVGAGGWGRNHVRTVAGLADAELSAVCDTDAKVRERLARQYPGALVTADVAALLGVVDAVIVAYPAATHASVARQVVEAGKPVLVEKPFALSVADAEAVARAAAERGVPVLAGHLLVYHPAVERLREMVQKGELGKVFYLYGLRVNLGQVRKDENALWSFGPHDVSVALYLLDEQPVRVAAHGKSYLQPAIEDVVFLTMEFASGVLAHVQMSWLDPHKERKLTVVGAKQMVVFDDMEPREKLRIYDQGVDRPPEYGSFGESLAIREGDIFIPRIPAVEPLAAELAHFVRAAQGREAPRTASRSSAYWKRRRARWRGAAPRRLHDGDCRCPHRGRHASRESEGPHGHLRRGRPRLRRTAARDGAGARGISRPWRRRQPARRRLVERGALPHSGRCGRDGGGRDPCQEVLRHRRSVASRRARRHLHQRADAAVQDQRSRRELRARGDRVGEARAAQGSAGRARVYDLSRHHARAHAARARIDRSQGRCGFLPGVFSGARRSGQRAVHHAQHPEGHRRDYAGLPEGGDGAVPAGDRYAGAGVVAGSRRAGEDPREHVPQRQHRARE